MAIISATATVTVVAPTATTTIVSGVLFHVNHELGRAFSWSSVGLAILTAFLQGLVTAIATMTEQSNRWTFRFRLARFEHWWWSVVSTLLLCSLVMNALSFASGTGGEPISVLALSATTFIAIVQYMIPSWQERHFTRCRWLAWTGDSRTMIPKRQAGFCGNSQSWKTLIEDNKLALSELQPTPSDVYGWHIWPAPGIAWDPTDVLNVAGPNNPLDLEDGDYHTGLYDNGEDEDHRASLKWGREQNFRRRVSRAVSSMPMGLLKSSPSTPDGYDGKGLTLAMGILGRNKGLNPNRLVFKTNRVVSSGIGKLLDYSGLGTEFVEATVELALLLVDMPYWAVEKWLEEGLEHQSLATNQFLAQRVLKNGAVTKEEREATLKAHYESSYVSMIISLNNMDRRMKHRHESGRVISRPDILCTGLLMKARHFPKPTWWDRDDVRERRANEIAHLDTEAHWKTPMACLLGLKEWPEGFEYHNSRWDDPKEPDADSLTHATDWDHPLFDRRAIERQQGTRERQFFSKGPNPGRGYPSSSQSTRIASGEKHHEHFAEPAESDVQPAVVQRDSMEVQSAHADAGIPDVQHGTIETAEKADAVVAAAALAVVAEGDGSLGVHAVGDGVIRREDHELTDMG